MTRTALNMYRSVTERPTANFRGVDVVISGYYGFDNSGDDSILKAMLQSLRQLKPDINAVVLSNKPDETARIYGVDAIDRFSFFKIRRVLKDAKLLISGGGSLIQDVTSARSPVYYLTLINMALKQGARVMLYANGIGPVNRRLNRRMAAKALGRVDYITLREEQSLDELKRLGVTNASVAVTSDPAFSLEPARSEAARSILANVGVDGKYFGIAVRDWRTLRGDFESALAALADYVYEKYDMQAVFIPMQPVRDAGISQRVLDCMAHKGAMLDPSGMAAEELLGIVANAEFIIGMRLHTLIYAAGSGVPVVGLVYDPKVEAMMGYMGQKFAVPLEDVTAENLRRCVDEIIENKDVISSELREIAAAARGKTVDTARIAVSYICKETGCL